MALDQIDHPAALLFLEVVPSALGQIEFARSLVAPAQRPPLDGQLRVRLAPVVSGDPLRVCRYVIH